jgi:hypothetical protein
MKTVIDYLKILPDTAFPNLVGRYMEYMVNTRFGTKNQNGTNRHKKFFGQKQKIGVQ